MGKDLDSLASSFPEKAIAPHSSTLAWKIPWMKEPGRLKSMGSLRVGHDWETSLSLFTFMHGEGNGNPLQCSCLENPRDGRAWWAVVYGVAQSRTRLKQLSSSSSLLSSTFYWAELASLADKPRKMGKVWKMLSASWTMMFGLHHVSSPFFLKFNI